MTIHEIYQLYLNHPVISTDTRKITEGCIFFALKGENFNGNKFAKEALNKGASYVIIDEKEWKVSEKCILVEDVLITLQSLANHHRKQLNIPFIGITGTNGKTTSKELINTVLSKKYKTIATKGNLNNHIGVPLTILSIPKDCEMAIIEMGANHIGEIAFLCNIAEPNYGVITNIGTAHIEGFGSQDNIIKTKNELYQAIKKNDGLIFINKDDLLLTDLAKNINQYSYGLNNANCNAKLISSSPTVILEWENTRISSKLYGKYNFDNILASICIGSYFQVTQQDIISAIESYKSTNNRSEIVIINDNTFYLDAYNANPSSMEVAIDTFSENTAKNKLMILGDMLELGEISNQEHQKIIDKVKNLGLSAVFVGKAFNSTKSKYDFDFVSDYREAHAFLEKKNLNNYHILIKGSRGIQLEKIIKP